MADQKLDTRFSLVIKPTTREQLRVLAELEDRSSSWVARAAIEEYVRRRFSEISAQAA